MFKGREMGYATFNPKPLKGFLFFIENTSKARHKLSLSPEKENTFRCECRWAQKRSHMINMGGTFWGLGCTILRSLHPTFLTLFLFRSHFQPCFSSGHIFMKMEKYIPEIKPIYLPNLKALFPNQRDARGCSVKWL